MEAMSTDSPGQRLLDRILAEMKAEGLEPDGREAETLRLASDLEDRRAELEDAIEEEGLSHTTKDGRVLMNPLVAEARQTTVALGRVLATVQMSAAPAKNTQKQKAAESRWRSHNIAKAKRVNGIG